MNFLLDSQKSSEPKDYWVYTGGFLQYCRVRGIIRDGEFYIQIGNTTRPVEDFFNAKARFETEEECIEYILKNKKKQLDTIREIIDTLENKRTKLIAEKKVESEKTNVEKDGIHCRLII